VRTKVAKRAKGRLERACKGLEPAYTLCMLQRRSDRACRALPEMRACAARVRGHGPWRREQSEALQRQLCPLGACREGCAGHRDRGSCEGAAGCGWALASSDFADDSTPDACRYEGGEVGPLYAKCTAQCEALRSSPGRGAGEACDVYDTACCWERDRPKREARCREGLRCVREGLRGGVCRCPAHPQETSYCCPVLHPDQPAPEGGA